MTEDKMEPLESESYDDGKGNYGMIARTGKIEGVLNPKPTFVLPEGSPYRLVFKCNTCSGLTLDPGSHTCPDNDASLNLTGAIQVQG